MNSEGFVENIDNKEIEKLPLTHFNGKIIVVESEENIDEAMSYLKNAAVIGFDTETRPAFKKGLHYKVALLQLALPDTVVIFRLNKTGLPDELVALLANEDIIKTGVAIHDDLKALQKLKKFTPGGFVELQKYVKEFGILDCGLKKLAANILGIRISKSQRLTNWEAEQLTEAQLVYAATDAWVGCLIFNVLNNLE
jgi:ribonuclease D